MPMEYQSPNKCCKILNTKSLNIVLGWILPPPAPPPTPNSYVRVLTSEYFGNKVFMEVIKLKRGHQGGPSSNRTGVLIKRGNLETDTHIGPYPGACGSSLHTRNMKSWRCGLSGPLTPWMWMPGLPQAFSLCNTETFPGHEEILVTGAHPKAVQLASLGNGTQALVHYKCSPSDS